MYQLSEEQIDFILDDIRARGVKLDSLQQSLLDHVCCIIEQGLEANGDFEGFYQTTIQSFYQKELVEIEEETILLIKFKHYYTMKRIMLLSGSFGVIGFLVGSIFKVFHLPGAAFLFLISILIISFVFLPLVFVLKAKEEQSFSNKFTLASGTIVAMLYCLSALFKVMHWPHANFMWYISLAIAVLIFIPGFLLGGIRNPETKVNSIVISILLVVVFGVQFLLTNLRPNSPTKSFAFLQSEVLLNSMLKESSNQYVLKEDSESVVRLNQIFQICEETKSVLLMNAIHSQHLPELSENPEENAIPELHLGDDFRENGKGYLLLKNLQQQVNEYNGLHPNEFIIPTKSSILKMDLSELNSSNNLLLLVNLSETQLIVTNLKLKFYRKAALQNGKQITESVNLDCQRVHRPFFGAQVIANLRSAEKISNNGKTIF
ncbi:MAG: hypothetical protein K1X82_12335 [Bacteroidia bacterium]|nr:hypothetical protein [Bacteroidia bacterium]